MSRRRVSKLPRGPALVAAGVLGLLGPGCGKKKDEERATAPQPVPPQPPPPADAMLAQPPQAMPPGDAAAAPVEDAATAPADAIKRTLDNLPGKLKPVPEDRRIQKDNKAPQPKLSPPPPQKTPPVIPNKGVGRDPTDGIAPQPLQKSEAVPSTRPPLVGPFDRSSSRRA